MAKAFARTAPLFPPCAILPAEPNVSHAAFYANPATLAPDVAEPEQLPADDNRHEILHGELSVTPMPRLHLAELMWQVVLADGMLEAQEAYLMHRLANLLKLEPAFLAQVRRNIEDAEG